MNYFIVPVVNPYITHQPVSQVAIPNGIVNFTCIVVAYPPPTYNWVTPIDNSSFNSNVIILEYEDIKPEYIGEYTCIASSNGMMVNSSTVYLSGMQSLINTVINYKLFVITHGYVDNSLLLCLAICLSLILISIPIYYYAVYTHACM